MELCLTKLFVQDQLQHDTFLLSNIWVFPIQTFWLIIPNKLIRMRLAFLNEDQFVCLEIIPYIWIGMWPDTL